jgi:hypothetical protein
MDLSYCHSSYWFPHLITNMSTFQIHFMFAFHAYGLLGVLNLLYSQCCGMATQRLYCSYKCQWNGTLHYGHLFLTTIKMIRHCGWYMCWQVPKIHAPFGPNGEQQIKNSFPFWGVGHKISLVFLTRWWHIPKWPQDLSLNLCLHSLTFLVICQETFWISLAMMSNRVIKTSHLHNILLTFL